MLASIDQCSGHRPQGLIAASTPRLGWEMDLNRIIGGGWDPSACAGCESGGALPFVLVAGHDALGPGAKSLSAQVRPEFGGLGALGDGKRPLRWGFVSRVGVPAGICRGDIYLTV